MARNIWEEGLRPLELDEEACEDCDGQGYFLVRIGERMCSGQGGPYEPVEVERECDSCRGHGIILCHEHGEEVVACWLIEASDVLCESCLEDMGTSLEMVKMEVIQRQCQDPLVQWGTAYREALLETRDEAQAKVQADTQLRNWLDLQEKGVVQI